MTFDCRRSVQALLRGLADSSTLSVRNDGDVR
jgi:hypothetical protein